MIETFNRRPGLSLARDTNENLTAPRLRAKALALPATFSFAIASPFPAAARRHQAVGFCLAAWRRTLWRLDRALLLVLVMAALTAPQCLAQNPPVPVFKLWTDEWYIQAGLAQNPSNGVHVFENPPAGPGAWCTPAEMVLNGTESVTARDYPLCPDAGGGLQRTRHDSAPHADDLVPSVPWEFDITCPVPPGFGANETRVTGVRTHPGAGHQDRYMAVVGALRGTVPGPSLAPRFVIIHGSIGKHSNSPQPPGPAPIVGGSRLEPPCRQPSPGDQDYPAGELLTLVDPASNRMLMLVAVEGASEADLGGVYVRDGTNGPIVADLRPLMQVRPLDTSAVLLTVQDQPVPASVVQVMASGNACIEMATTAHPDGRLVGALEAVSSTSSYQVQLQPGWNVVANQLSRGGNTLAEVLPTVPAGSIVYKYDPTNRNYSTSTYDPRLSRWSNPTLALPPGQGVFIRNPSSTAYAVTLVGEVLGDGRLDLPAGWTVLAARQMPASATYEQIAGQAPANGTKLYRYNTASQTDPKNLTNWQEYVFSDGLWSPGTPVMLVAEPVFIQVPAAPIAPAILVQPQSQAVAAGSAVSFAVQASGTPLLTYQWSLNGQPIPGATDATLSLAAVQSAQAGAYRVTVANAGGLVSSDPAQLQVNNPPALESMTPMVLHQGEHVHHWVLASDPDGNRVNYELGPDAPAGMVLDRDLGLLTWDTTAVAPQTTREFTVRVTDNGMPPLSVLQTGIVSVVAPLQIQGMVRSDGEVRITWNSIAGREYIVRAAADMTRPQAEWEYRAGMVAEGEMTTWTGFLDTDIPGGFYTVTTTCGHGCQCAAVRKLRMEPKQGGGGAKTDFKSVQSKFNGMVATSATVEAPFTIKAAIKCTDGDTSKNCTATLRIGASATCEIIDGTGTRLLGPVTADPFNVQNNDPKAEEWKTIKGNCSQEREWSAEAKCVANFNLGGLDEGARHRLVANPATAWIRATFTFSVWVECNGEDLGPVTITMVTDARAAAADGRWGHFDRDASDLDGDKKTGKDEKDNTTPNLTQTQRYAKDLDPNPDPLLPR